jgi:hypothetical protein
VRYNHVWVFMNQMYTRNASTTGCGACTSSFSNLRRQAQVRRYIDHRQRSRCVHNVAYATFTAEPCTVAPTFATRKVPQ